VLLFKARTKRFEFQDIAKQPIERINNDHIEGSLLAERVGKQFFKTLALFQIAIGSLALVNICLRYRITILFRPFAACAQLRLNGLILFIQGCSSCPCVNDAVCCCFVVLFVLILISFELFSSDC
jgi:hypothetical protein